MFISIAAAREPFNRSSIFFVPFSTGGCYQNSSKNGNLLQPEKMPINP